MTRVTLMSGGLGRRWQREHGSACRAAHALSCLLQPASNGPIVCSLGARRPLGKACYRLGTQWCTGQPAGVGLYRYVAVVANVPS